MAKTAQKQTVDSYWKQKTSLPTKVTLDDILGTETSELT